MENEIVQLKAQLKGDDETCVFNQDSVITDNTCENTVSLTTDSTVEYNLVEPEHKNNLLNEYMTYGLTSVHDWSLRREVERYISDTNIELLRVKSSSIVGDVLSTTFNDVMSHMSLSNSDETPMRAETVELIVKQQVESASATVRFALFDTANEPELSPNTGNIPDNGSVSAFDTPVELSTCSEALRPASSIGDCSNVAKGSSETEVLVINSCSVSADSCYLDQDILCSVPDTLDGISSACIAADASDTDNSESYEEDIVHGSDDDLFCSQNSDHTTSLMSYTGNMTVDVVSSDQHNQVCGVSEPVSMSDARLLERIDDSMAENMNDEQSESEDKCCIMNMSVCGDVEDHVNQMPVMCSDADMMNNVNCSAHSSIDVALKLHQQLASSSSVLEYQCLPKRPHWTFVVSGIHASDQVRVWCTGIYVFWYFGIVHLPAQFFYISHLCTGWLQKIPPPDITLFLGIV